ncbi:MAG: type II toxin-antitoxin system VapB family antitoxin [Kineosporiaceae bacterium]
MGLNIKNERVHALARQAALVTGKSQTSAIEEALERLLEAYGVDPDAARAARRVDLVQSLVAAYNDDPGRPDRPVRAIEDLFEDATGMPR